MGTLLVGIDLGTTALKIAVFDLTGKELASSTHEYTLLTPANNFVESYPNIYTDAIRAGFKALQGKVDLKNVAAIGFSAQSETLVFVDAGGKPLRNAIGWMDSRGISQAARMTEKFGDELCYQKTGQVGFAPNWPAAKVMWVKENEPEVFAKVGKILCLEDYIIHYLCGSFVADGAMLTSTLYWDITTKKYWKEMLEYLGTPENIYPEIRESGEVAGTILPDIARELGINPDAKICTGAMDNAIGAVGVGAVRAGVFSESIGSSLAVCVPTEKITYDPNRVMPVHYYPMKDTYMMHTFTTGGMCLRWFRDNFCRVEKDYADLTGEDNYDLLTREADTVAPGAGGLVFLPHLNGALAPDINPNALGIFFGITMVHRKPHFVRAIMESLGYLVRRNIDALANMGIKVDEVRAFGGGSKSASWCQIKADILQKPICVTNSRDTAACLGAAVLAGYAVGIFKDIQSACDNMIQVVNRFEPNPANAAIYNRGYEKYIKLQASLGEMFEFAARN